MLEIRLDAMRNFLAAAERRFDLDQTVSLDPADRRRFHGSPSSFVVTLLRRSRA